MSLQLQLVVVCLHFGFFLLSVIQQTVIVSLVDDQLLDVALVVLRVRLNAQDLVCDTPQLNTSFRTSEESCLGWNFTNVILMRA